MSLDNPNFSKIQLMIDKYGYDMGYGPKLTFKSSLSPNDKFLNSVSRLFFTCQI